MGIRAMGVTTTCESVLTWNYDVSASGDFVIFTKEPSTSSGTSRSTSTGAQPWIPRLKSFSTMKIPMWR